MNDSLELPSALAGWLESTFPEHPHRSVGVSGAALLYEAFRRESRGAVILPAFTSYTLSGAATAAGKQVIHVDADPATLHMRLDLLDEAIRAVGAENAIVLVDHTCGHPFPRLAALRERHPGVLIVEDCVRALGGEANGEPLGTQGDWTLISLYKTVTGNLNGAILLSRTPLDLPIEEREPVALKQRAAGLRIARQLHHRVRRGLYSEPDRDRGTLKWSPKTGSPNSLCVQRFERWLQYLPQRCEAQRAAATEIRQTLGEIQGMTWIDDAPDCLSADHFLSFTVAQTTVRNALLASMHAKGFTLERTWHVVPSYYRGFAGSFPFGSAGSEYLADHIVHIPVGDYLDKRRRLRLIEAIRQSAHKLMPPGN